MGRASNRKKARRQAGRSSPQARQGSRGRAAPRQTLPQLAAGLQALSQEMEMPGEQDAACRAWCGGQEPTPAVVPRWPEGSLGDRLCSSAYLARAQSAPCLLTADVPDAAVIFGDPARWSLTARVLVRAVTYDGLRADHPAVSTLADTLAPVAGAELAHGEAIEDCDTWAELDEEEDKPEFPVLDGPVFLIGTCALVDATQAVAGDDPLTEVHAVLASIMDGVFPGMAGHVVADALVGAAAVHGRYDRPGDADMLKRIDGSPGALEHLATVGAVSPNDVLRAGLAILSALAEIGKSRSSSILRPAA